MTQEQTIPLFEEVVNGWNKLSLSGGVKKESSDLRRARQSAFDKFRELGFPSIRNEEWKYTNLARFLKDEFTIEGWEVPGKTVVPDAALVKKAGITLLDCYQIVLVNGSWDGTIGGGTLPKGIQLLKVAEARQDPALSVYFEKQAAWGDQHFANLNAALFTDGLFIRVDAGVTVEKPIHVIHVYTSESNLLVQPRNVWVVNRNAELSVVESVVSGGTAKIWVNGLTEILVHQDARLHHTMIQTAGAGVRLVQQTTVHQHRQSLYNNFTITLPGADLVRNDLQARLEEEHTESHLYGLYLAAGHQLVDNHTLVDHQKPNCLSNELYKGVLLEQSTGVFNGKVYVHKDAQKTNAFQQNNNLVISKKATIDSKPQLEIFADDVKCSHGSTVGQFSEEALFYLRARGIGEESAKSLLINAFAFDVTEKIRIPEVEAHVNELISLHIPVNHA
ncbi:Fe-S cluster assembly protein SufD [Flavitalea sp. BT771]|uniref:Fe-S cluster assembly protein SufD n=1 Tax=Flavitalea sp. BT771 TaxID=3063329 RepID=UPI0026E2DFA5|nr:Fe-S cluster assembly protein SufD [Flavitalea sp. BT771]MDO6429897.1 Fe-S cluster assembly protein SufD [Flavitalea sp. BT771]MDV6217975.1 Fe-S cluster assembly protein SufD [Flavitalea sp. BT771]